MIKIERYPLNGYWIEIYCEPNTDGKSYLDEYYGEIICQVNGCVLKHQSVELEVLKTQLYSIAAILSGKHYSDIYIPKFNKVSAE